MLESYHKTHLFNLDIPGQKLVESAFTLPGKRIVAPVQTPVGRVGMATVWP